MAEISGKQPFTALPSWIFYKQKAEPGWLSAYELAILLALQHFANGLDSGNCVFPSYNTLCAYAGISRKTAIKCITLLQEKGLIKKEARYSENEQKTNVYHLVFWSVDQTQSTPGTAQCISDTTQCTSDTGAVQEMHHPSAGDAPPQCASCTRTRTIEQEPMNNKNPPISPLRGGQPPAAIELPSWLEEYREPLTAWLEKRKKKHKLDPELSTLTIRALEYANSLGILQIYCEYISEYSWVSLGFAGYKDAIDKLAKDHGIEKDQKPKMAPIVYTLN